MSARDPKHGHDYRSDYQTARSDMVERQIASRGLTDERVLRAMRRVPRHEFVAEELAEFAYDDAPLPIESGQTISQPYMVALMAAVLELEPDDRVLEIGTGSGYAAAVLAELADEVFTVERHEILARSARQRFERLGYENVSVLHGDGTLGWPEHAPYDGIVVAAGGPEVPTPLKEQLAIGGRLVIPVGSSPRLQRLLRVTRVSEGTYEEENLGDVRFVPLVGLAGWEAESSQSRAQSPAQTSAGGSDLGRGLGRQSQREAVVDVVSRAAESFDGPAPDLDGLLDRIGDARVVLLGEATHGTREFYRFRAELTKRLITDKGFRILGLEADWPDASRIDAYIRRPVAEDGAADPTLGQDWVAFSRFPTWMWRNETFADLVDWLHDWNADRAPEDQAGVYGLDLYSLYTSIGAVLDYLDNVDPEAAHLARQRYGCLSPWEGDPATYGRAALTGSYRSCEDDVVAILTDMVGRHETLATRDGEAFMSALQNARLVANAEKYFRVMYYGSRQAWNLRDQHMYDTLSFLLDYRGTDAKAVVWAHNSHCGNAAATEMGAQGQHNIGQLARQGLGDGAYLVGFGTHSGTVAAASDWDGPMEIKPVRPSHPESYERVMHDAGARQFLLHLREPRVIGLRDRLMVPKLERAIGVIYRPESELLSHYFQATLPQQFDEYVWFDETHALVPLATTRIEAMPETYPFGL